MDIQKVGVLGAGVIGTSLSQALAQTGHDVYLIDVSSEILEKAKKSFINGLRLEIMLNKDMREEDPQAILQKVTFSVDYNILAGVDYLIENVTEKWDIKKDVYKKVDEICRKECIFASNTSAIPIKKIASLTSHPEKVIGLHFMNPVTMKPSVEMIQSDETSAETIESSQKLLSQMKKNWILVNDSPGFVSNRVLMLTINEAIYLLDGNVASCEDIDRIFRSCFGYKMGPLETADLIGLDTILLTLEVLHENFKTSKFEPCPLLKKMVDQGHRGRKSGKGFYTYTS